MEEARWTGPGAHWISMNRRKVFFFLLFGLVLLSLNLRTATTDLSPVAAQIGDDIHGTTAEFAIIGALPPLCFAVFGALSPILLRYTSIETACLLLVVMIFIGNLLRGLSDDFMVLAVGSVLAFAGMGSGNVLSPPFVKRYFARSVGLVTSLYVGAISVGTFLPPLVAVPITHLDGWRLSFQIWTLLAFVAVLAWVLIRTSLIGQIRRLPGIEELKPDRANSTGHATIALVKSPTVWALTIIFTIVSLNAFIVFAWLPQILSDTAGLSPASAGTALSLYAALGVPLGIIIPSVVARHGRGAAVVLYLTGIASFILGSVGLLVVPGALVWLWVVILGLGPIIFPLSLVLIPLRCDTEQMSVAVSAVVQAVGYLVAAAGPFLAGMMRNWSGDWSGTLWMVIGCSAISLVVAPILGRRTSVEAEIALRLERQR